MASLCLHHVHSEVVTAHSGALRFSAVDRAEYRLEPEAVKAECDDLAVVPAELEVVAVRLSLADSAGTALVARV